jgi:hypothetical protein
MDYTIRTGRNSLIEEWANRALSNPSQRDLGEQLHREFEDALMWDRSVVRIRPEPGVSMVDVMRPLQQQYNIAMNRWHREAELPTGIWEQLDNSYVTVPYDSMAIVKRLEEYEWEHEQKIELEF